MSARQSFLAVCKRVGPAGGFLFALCFTAAYNFLLAFRATLEAAGAAGTHTTPDGFEVIVCYLGLPSASTRGSLFSSHSSPLAPAFSRGVWAAGSLRCWGRRGRCRLTRIGGRLRM